MQVRWTAKAAKDLTPIVERIRKDVVRACAGVAQPLVPGSIDGGNRDRKEALREGQRSNDRIALSRSCGSVLGCIRKQARVSASLQRTVE